MSSALISIRHYFSVCVINWSCNRPVEYVHLFRKNVDTISSKERLREPEIATEKASIQKTIVQGSYAQNDERDLVFELNNPLNTVTHELPLSISFFKWVFPQRPALPSWEEEIELRAASHIKPWASYQLWCSTVYSSTVYISICLADQSNHNWKSVGTMQTIYRWIHTVWYLVVGMSFPRTCWQCLVNDNIVIAPWA